MVGRISNQLSPLPSNRKERRPEQLGRFERVFQGMEGQNVPTDFSIPASSLRDVDEALFNFFAFSLNLQVSIRNITKTVPVVFAGAERYAMTHSDKPLRSKDGMIVTPIMSIHRTSVLQGTEPSMAFGVDTGDVVIKRRFSKQDRYYQNLVNRFGLRNQDNVASDANIQDVLPPGSIAKAGKVASRRRTGGTQLQDALRNPINDNIIEILTIPTPNFLTLRYKLTFWTSYVNEMNQIIDRILAAHDIGSLYNARIESNKGYWYVAYFDKDWNMDDNFTDYSSQKRLIKSTLNVSVPCYTLASDGPGDPLPVRRFLSAPSLDFETCQTDAIIENIAVQMPMLGPEDPAFIREDVEQIPIDGRSFDGPRRNPIAQREFMFNPFATSQANGDPRFSQVTCRTTKGERVGRVTDALTLERIHRR